jgi:hypothetical protein
VCTQKELSWRQAQWIHKCSGFGFKIVHVRGTENVLADALFRMYSNDSPGTVHEVRVQLPRDLQTEKLELAAKAISIPANTRSLRSKTRVLPA